MKRGFAPMPPDVAERSEKAGRYTVFLIHALVLALILSLMSTHSVPPSGVGLHVDHWPTHLLPGLAAGLFWMGLYGLLLSQSPALKQSLTADFHRQGSALFWVVEILLGTFTQELWRGFCLFALMTSRHSHAWSVILTAVAYGVPDLQLSVGRALGRATFGVATASLFVWQGSLVTTYAFGLLLSLSSLYWVRSVGRSADYSKSGEALMYPLCPTCGASIRYQAMRGGTPFLCPVCGEKLQIVPLRPLYAVVICAACVLLSYLFSKAIGLHEVVLFLATITISLPVYLVGAILKMSIMPPKLQRYTARDISIAQTGATSRRGRMKCPFCQTRLSFPDVDLRDAFHCPTCDELLQISSRYRFFLHCAWLASWILFLVVLLSLRFSSDSFSNVAVIWLFMGVVLGANVVLVRSALLIFPPKLQRGTQYFTTLNLDRKRPSGPRNQAGT
jgi:predicted RNA-binding Zn-ribbon protein involved in translation (DUF1610 family)